MKSIKRMLVLLLVLALTLSLPTMVLAAEATTITVGNINGQPGETVEVPVRISNSPGILAAKLIFDVPTGLTLEGVTKGELLSGEEANIDYIVNGNIVLLAKCLEINGTSDGELLVLHVKIGNETAANSYAVGITVEQLVDKDLKEIGATAVAGTITVEAASAAPEVTMPESLPAENVTFEGNTMTINSNLGANKTMPACVVLVKAADGSYTKISATANGDGTYSYDMSGVEGEIVIAVMGDVTGDGYVKNNDVLRMKQLANRINMPDDDLYMYVGDVVTGGELPVNNTDVLKLKQIANGIGAAITW